jgi:hypothetical protein
VGFLPIKTEVNTGTLHHFVSLPYRMGCEKQITGLLLMFDGEGKS